MRGEGESEKETFIASIAEAAEITRIAIASVRHRLRRGCHAHVHVYVARLEREGECVCERGMPRA